MAKQSIGKYATELLAKCFIITDEVEKSQGARVDKFGRQVPVNQRNTYVYDSSNELYSESDKGRVVTKAGSLEAPNTTQFRIERERAAQQARAKYLNNFENSSRSVSKIYMPGDTEKTERARAGDSEMIELMRELVNQNKTLSYEVQTLKSQIQSKPQIYRSPSIKKTK